ncbi:hypothetical protein [Terrimicrobium sacchariphilum]|nr:hypothetical protein [Terrimicrobium sacchariphilum]
MASLVAVVAMAGGAWGDEASRYVWAGVDGRLQYAADDRGNHIPDFSMCGYRRGEVEIPSVAVVATLESAPGDASDRVQAAIDAIAARPPDASGIRGVLLLRKGEYRLSRSLRISASGIVLRGEGNGADGTVLLATTRSQYSLVEIGTDNLPTTWKPVSGTWQKIVDAYVPVGASTLSVKDASRYKVGDPVVIQRPSTAEWIHALGMDSIPPRSDGGEVVQWEAGRRNLHFDRVITAITGNRITVDAPICNSLDAAFGGGVIFRHDLERLQEVGIENLRGDSLYDGPTDEQHGWTFITFNNVENGWVQDVTAVHFGYACVQLGKFARAITVERAKSLEPVSLVKGGRRYAFAVSGQLCLVRDCYSEDGRHDFVFGGLTPGPNVFLDCTAERAQADSGPHLLWSCGMLFDNVTVKGNELNIRNRGNLGTGQGWTGANSVLWNCSADRLVCENPPTAQNWAIGCVGAVSGNANRDLPGMRASPPSLYRAQLRDRLGK